MVRPAQPEPGRPVYVLVHWIRGAGVGVTEATEVDLPDQLTHDGSLLFVVRQRVGR